MRPSRIPYKYAVAAAFVSGLFMDLMDLTIVNVALPRLGVDFHTSNATTLEWVITGYLLSLAIWIPASGWIGDRIGTKKTFLFALAMFTTCSALCGLSWSMGSLIAFRILQGVGGGMLTPVGVAMLFRAFPPAERARASTILTVPTVIAPALGPILGGWLVDSVTWRAIFWVNLPVGVGGFVFSLLFLREHREPSAGRFVLAGFLLSGGGLALILYALSRGPDDGWTAANVLATGIAGLAAFIALVTVETHIAEPMLALRLLTDRLFRTSNAAYFLAMASLLSQFLLLTLFLQQLEGRSAFQAGLAVLPFSIGTIITAPIVGRIYPHVGPSRLVAAGLAGAAATSALFLLVDLKTSIWWIAAFMFLRGLAFGSVFVAVQVATYATIESRDTGRASSIFNTNRQVAQSIGVAIVITILATRSKELVAAAVRAAAPAARGLAAQQAVVHAYHDAYLATVALAVLGTICALLIHDEDAAATMAPGAQRPAVAAD
jgi:EmrB/QacA subfamily drug resistance transporter